MFHKQNEIPTDKAESISISDQSSFNEKKPEYEPTFLNPYL
jgi:hypothetical protein